MFYLALLSQRISGARRVKHGEVSGFLFYISVFAEHAAVELSYSKKINIDLKKKFVLKQSSDFGGR